MTDHQIKSAAIAKLLEEKGIQLVYSAPFRTICEAIGRFPRAGSSLRQVVCEYVGIAAHQPKVPINPAYRAEFRPLPIMQHPRLADIERGQPPMRAMAANGAAYVRSWGGQEARD